jgi:hypothetical protein
MEWQSIGESLVASGPLAGLLGFAVWKLWARLLETEKKNDDLQEARINDLKSLITK